MKTIVFTMFLRGWDIRIQHISHSKLIKKYTCNPNMFFDTSNHRKYRKVTPNGLQWFPPYPIHQNSGLAQERYANGPVPFGRLEIASNLMRIPMPSHDPKMTDFDRQMPPKVSKMTPQSDPKLIRFRKSQKSEI
jgi:hypothetical protein